MRSKEPEYRAAYWKKWAAKNQPKVVKVCSCGDAFSPRGRQARCEQCLHRQCPTCLKAFRIKGGAKERKCCSRSCAALQPHVIERINKHRGTKPRTYHLHHRERGNVFDREWRIAVFKRDDYTCRRCSVRGGKLEAHHVKPYKEFPRLRYVLSNGLTLCVPCHKRTKTYGWQKYHSYRKQVAAKRMSQEVLQFDQPHPAGDPALPAEAG